MNKKPIDIHIIDTFNKKVGKMLRDVSRQAIIESEEGGNPENEEDITVYVNVENGDVFISVGDWCVTPTEKIYEILNAELPELYNHLDIGRIGSYTLEFEAVPENEDEYDNWIMVAREIPSWFSDDKPPIEQFQAELQRRIECLNDGATSEQIKQFTDAAGRYIENCFLKQMADNDLEDND